MRDSALNTAHDITWLRIFKVTCHIATASFWPQDGRKRANSSNGIIIKQRLWPKFKPCWLFLVAVLILMEHMQDDSYTLPDTCHRISVQHAFHKNIKRERMMFIFYVQTRIDKEKKWSPTSHSGKSPKSGVLDYSPTGRQGWFLSLKNSIQLLAKINVYNQFKFLG